MATLAEATAAKSEAKRRFGDRVSVGITGDGAGGYALKVNVAGPTTTIPAHIDGVPVRVEVVGKLKKRPTDA